MCGLPTVTHLAGVLRGFNDIAGLGVGASWWPEELAAQTLRAPQRLGCHDESALLLPDSAEGDRDGGTADAG
jgi:hypothetical protein